jgi:hypothetical protein
VKRIKIGGKANVAKKAVAAPIRKGSFNFNNTYELRIIEKKLLI